ELGELAGTARRLDQLEVLLGAKPARRDARRRARLDHPAGQLEAGVRGEAARQAGEDVGRQRHQARFAAPLLLPDAGSACGVAASSRLPSRAIAALPAPSRLKPPIDSSSWNASSCSRSDCTTDSSDPDSTSFAMCWTASMLRAISSDTTACS